jgi:hypothetical protein
VNGNEGNERVFIPAWFDDYGLTANERCVYTHISRRGNCWSSVDTMASVCRLHPDTVWKVLKVLVAQQLIERKKRPGDTTVFRIADPAQRLPPYQPEKEGRVTHRKQRGGTHPKVRGEGYPKEMGDHPPESKGHKGNPSEGSPIEGNPSKEEECVFPENLQTDNFKTAWLEWQDYSKANKLKGVPDKQLEFLSGLGEQQAIESINASMRNGWRGIFPPKAEGTSVSVHALKIQNDALQSQIGRHPANPESVYFKEKHTPEQWEELRAMYAKMNAIEAKMARGGAA